MKVAVCCRFVVVVVGVSPFPCRHPARLVVTRLSRVRSAGLHFLQGGRTASNEPPWRPPPLAAQLPESVLSACVDEGGRAGGQFCFVLCAVFFFFHLIFF